MSRSDVKRLDDIAAAAVEIADIHYHCIDPDELWTTAQIDVPQLVAALAEWRAQRDRS